jgi:hypothetical protein
MRLVPEAWRDPLKSRALVDTAVERLQGLPGVEAVAIARVVPLNDHMVHGSDLSTDLGSPPAHVEFNMKHALRVDPVVALRHE